MPATDEEWDWIGEHRSDRIRGVAVAVAVVSGAAGAVTLVLVLLAYGRMPSFSSYPPGPAVLVLALLAPSALLVTALGAVLLRRWARDGFLLDSGAVRARRGSVLGVLVSLVAVAGTAVVTRPPVADLAPVTLPALVITGVVAVLYLLLLRRPTRPG
ncbi:hypothetical protein [Actinomycetospora straminea]|uniref:hypothetical protein n=1 Tax=Actinomycetospora straminea TaxID=663607 RepID=UPI0023662D44|nr:hypothetical protein [Actinomycetospora straminea]MDD7931025.1 hypothetical protein [Actinomycetospora straminea]